MKTTLRNPSRWPANVGLVSSVITILLFATSCSTTMLTDYVPKNDLDRLTAEAIIRQVLEEQPQEYRPSEIKFGEEALRLTVIRRHINKPFARGHEESLLIAIYYRSLGKTEVFSRKGRVVVMLRNKHDEVLRKVFLPDESESKQFLDALETLRIRSANTEAKKRE